MKNIIAISLALFIGLGVEAQNNSFSTTSTQSNPFSKIGITNETVVINGYDHIPQGDSIMTLYGWEYNKHTGHVETLQAETDIDSTTQLFAGEKPYRWLSVDPIVHPYQSPYTGFDNNPVLYVDPDGKNVWIAVNATTKEYIGHAALFITSYQKVYKMINGKQTEVWMKTGYIHADLSGLRPENYEISKPISGDPNFEDYDGVVMVNETNPPVLTEDGIEYYLQKDIQMDLDVMNKAKFIKAQNKDYKIVGNNCVDFCKESIAVIGKGYENPSLGTQNIPINGSTKISTPNQFLKDLSKKAKVVKEYKSSTNGVQDYIDNPANKKSIDDQ